MTRATEFQQVLLVEGKTDLHVVLALCQQYHVTENFDIRDCDGISRLLRHLSLLLTNPSNIKTIGIIIDADNDMKARLDQIRNVLSPYGYLVPKALSNTGLVCSSSLAMYPKMGLWLMPDNVNMGMVEDFAISLVSPVDELMMEAENELLHIEQRGINRYPKSHRSKAKIHTYLAWQSEPGMPIGLSVTQKVLDSNHPIAKSFVQNWLIPLFQ